MIRGVAPRVGLNLLAFIAFAVGIVLLAIFTFASGLFLDDSYRVTAMVPDAGGVLPRQQVTVMGRAVGTVADAQLVDGGVELAFDIQPQFSVPEEANLRIVRRSPIGEQAVDLVPLPPQGWKPLERDGTVTVADARPSPTVEDLLTATVELFREVSPENTATIIHELATAFEGRSDVLKELNRATVDVGETILAEQDTIRRFLDTSEPFLTELEDHADDLVELFENQADLNEVLAANRPNLEELLRLSPNMLGEAEALIVNIRPDAQCLVEDLITVNEMLLGPSTATGAPRRFYDTKLDETQMAIDKHRFFFQIGIPFTIITDDATGVPWVRIKFELDKLGSGQRYPEKRATPATRPGAACETAEWGPGVQAVRQPGTDRRGLDVTSPGIRYAPLVDGATSEDDDGITGRPGGTSGPPTPATGGGLALLAVAATAGALLVRRRP